MKKALSKLQIFLFEKGSHKSHHMYERVGNIVQDIRLMITNKK